MPKPIRFTKHARQKFIDLETLGFKVTEAQVIETIDQPDTVEVSVFPPIAQRQLSDRPLLRVVFVEEDEEIRIITFYPSRRTRYEDEI